MSFFIFLQIPIVLEANKHRIIKFCGQALFQHRANQMLCAEARKSVLEEELVGKMSQIRVQKASSLTRSYTILNYILS